MPNPRNSGIELHTLTESELKDIDGLEDLTDSQLLQIIEDLRVDASIGTIWYDTDDDVGFLLETLLEPDWRL